MKPSDSKGACVMNSIGKFLSGCVLVLSMVGCNAHAERDPKVPCPFTAKSYERVCKHPSMTKAAFREAYACHGFKPETAAVRIAQR
jgi:hypothetical protein